MKYTDPMFNQHAPKGYSFFFQAVGSPDERHARMRVASLWSKDIAAVTLFVKGVYRMPTDGKKSKDPWPFKPDDGFMCFVPDSFVLADGSLKR